MRIEEIKIYKFNELSSQSQEKAILKYRENNLNYEWWQFVYEDAANIADVFGLNIRQTRETSKDKTKVLYDPTIYFAGFSSQGDCACFEGNYSYKKGSLKAIKSEAPQDKELHNIVSSLQKIQHKNFYSVNATIKQRGYYNHSGCMDISLENTLNDTVIDEDDFIQCFRDFADWIYGRLENEYDYLQSDEVIKENIEANEHEFLENGDMY